MTKREPNHVEWGKPSIDEAKCTACGLCAGICPTETIQMMDGKPTPMNRDKLGCLACGHCVAICPVQAISVTGRGMKADDVFPLPHHSERAGSEALAALLQSRRSMRRYADRPVDKETVQKLLGMAATAPMGFPPSPVGVVVVHGKQRVQELANDLMPALEKWRFFGTPVGSLVMRLIMDQPTRGLMRTYVLPVTEEI